MAFRSHFQAMAILAAVVAIACTQLGPAGQGAMQNARDSEPSADDANPPPPGNALDREEPSAALAPTVIATNTAATAGSSPTTVFSSPGTVGCPPSGFSAKIRWKNKSEAFHPEFLCVTLQMQNAADAFAAVDDSLFHLSANYFSFEGQSPRPLQLCGAPVLSVDFPVGLRTGPATTTDGGPGAQDSSPPGKPISELHVGFFVTPRPDEDPTTCREFALLQQAHFQFSVHYRASGGKLYSGTTLLPPFDEPWLTLAPMDLNASD
ncbi:MAG: hypothetical protein IT572_11485 [Deltaproteobacteria bacterium]|nr:hypothetical protein [Deltaproteobacteria bacterium]